jgi:hypothetical protein
MKNSNQNDKATARPWKVWQDDSFLAPPVQIIDSYGRIIAKTNVRDEQTDNANAALIVKSVNQHEALTAVAEAAKILVTHGENSGMIVGRTDLLIALDQLDTCAKVTNAPQF